MAPLTKSTRVFATHQIPLECDIYEAGDYPPTSPVLLFFHSGALVGGSRRDVHPWLVQTCLKQKWPLVSASYRLFPQVLGDALLEDALAAYAFARGLGGVERRVIVSGASAGFFMATILAHHSPVKPLALLSITGIPTFHHPFFNSSTLIPPSPIKEEEVEPFFAEPVSVGMRSATAFSLDMLLPSGDRNPDFDASAQPVVDALGQDPSRGMLYDYFLYENAYESLVGGVDLGFEWAGEEAGSLKLKEWPVTVFIQGDEDVDVHMDVCVSVAEKLGELKGRMFLAKGQGHLFERASFIEDEGPGMAAVRGAVEELKRAVAAALEASV